MMSILSVLSHKDLTMLIPHLEEWVLQHAIAKTDDIPSYVDKYIWLMDYRVHTALFQVGSSISPGGYWSHIISVKSLYQGPEYEIEETNRANLRATGFNERTVKTEASAQERENRELLKSYPALKELENSNGEWWLWSFRTGGLSWVLVDYR